MMPDRAEASIQKGTGEVKVSRSLVPGWSKERLLAWSFIFPGSPPLP